MFARRQTREKKDDSNDRPNQGWPAKLAAARPNFARYGPQRRVHDTRLKKISLPSVVPPLHLSSKYLFHHYLILVHVVESAHQRQDSVDLMAAPKNATHSNPQTSHILTFRRALRREGTSSIPLLEDASHEWKRPTDVQWVCCAHSTWVRSRSSKISTHEQKRRLALCSTYTNK